MFKLKGKQVGKNISFVRCVIFSDISVFRRVNFRWWQKGGPTSSFALDDVYIGRPCPNKCHGNGVCSQGQQCKCNDGYKGEN